MEDIDMEGSKMSTCGPKSGAGPGGFEPPPQAGVVVQLGAHPPPVEASGVAPASGLLAASAPASGPFIGAAASGDDEEEPVSGDEEEEPASGGDSASPAS
jgi:hypothetical protein